MTTRLLTSEASGNTRPDAIVVGIIEGAEGPRLAPGAEPIDDALGGTLISALTALGATGKAEETTKVASGPLSGGSSPAAVAPLIVAAGLGKPGGQAMAEQVPAFDPELLRRAAGAALREIVEPLAKAVPGHGMAGVYRVALALPARDDTEAEAAALGGLLGGYVFSRYRTTVAAPPDLELTVCGDGVPTPAAAHRAQALADAVALVRDMVNTGPSHLVPATLADEAEKVAAARGLDVEVLDEEALAEDGYGGILAVGQGSVHPPRLVRLGYRHPGAVKTVVFAGKGITFDSGGLSLKPPKSMEHMKSDMAGAAAVLGAMQAIADLRPVVNVVGYLASAENMPGGRAQRPADIITIHGGKTVEVLNTDAEGRLVLADALDRALGDSPDLLVDVATLTGAQTVALGRRTAGVMANHDEVRDGIVASARRAGEAFWPMPLPDELRDGLDSEVADLANVSPDRSGGMLVGGLFLREFVTGQTRWAHLDIAGPAFNEDDAHGYTPKGGTGAAVRTLTQIALDVADGLL
ncbi:MAG TPA: leucyl aminopeptidase [Streptosporangiaceae bacterium]|nr:leucyl aminopeptidase [Streptosporangiaceae bacterium]